jgi:hypothetical protein
MEDGGRLHQVLSLVLTEFGISHSSSEGENRKKIKKLRRQRRKKSKVQWKCKKGGQSSVEMSALEGSLLETKHEVSDGGCR